MASTDDETVTVVVSYQAQPGRAEAARRELAELITLVAQVEPDWRGIRLLVNGADPFIERAGAFLAGPPDIRILRQLSRS